MLLKIEKYFITEFLLFKSLVKLLLLYIINLYVAKNIKKLLTRCWLYKNFKYIVFINNI